MTILFDRATLLTRLVIGLMPTIKISIWKIAWLPLLLMAKLAANAPQQPAPAGELARVAILEFQDNTGQKGYGWIKTSLPDAINNSMKDQFEFSRAELRLPKTPPGAPAQDEILTEEYIGRLAQEQNIDIVIFGSYSYDAKKRMAEFSAQVYHLKGKRIIGTVNKPSRLNNDVFDAIESISRKIVEHIYRFSLDLNEQQVAEKRDQDVRLLVLVPTWTTDAQKKAALGELEIQKKELRKKYPAEFLTLFEFFRTRKTPTQEQQQIENFAKVRNEAAIAEWLRSQKVTNAMIVFVADNRVSLRPVVDGKGKPAVSYAVNAPAGDRLGAIQGAVVSSGMETNLQKTALRKDPGIRDRFSLAGGLFLLAPVGAGSDKIDAAAGVETQALYRQVNLWIFQLGVAAALQATSQKKLLTTGEEDFTLQHMSALIGPLIAVPLPFYRSLELQVLLLGGTAYSKLVKYKYADTPLNFSGLNFAGSLQTELRWHIWRGIFIGLAAGYHQIFFPGTHMSYLNTSLRAGYRF
ncbi:MAG: hypothetical protein OHK0011_13440 [Turneriella sp.]